MPPRWLTAVIIVFWVAATSWFVYREIWPYYRPGSPPPITFSLTDEVGATTALWDVYFGNKLIGAGKSDVYRHGDGTYELSSEVKFLNFNVLSDIVQLPFTVDINKLSNSFRVTPEGQLVSMDGKTVVTFSWGDGGVPLQCNIDYRGLVKDKLLTLNTNADQPIVKAVLDTLPREPIPVEHNIMNSMQLLDRLQHLYDGRTWTVPLFNPTGTLGIGQDVSIRILEAKVVRGSMMWNGENTACWKIEYRRPNTDEVVAATWVRRSDALVLQQEANYARMNLVMLRQPVKEE